MARLDLKVEFLDKYVDISAKMLDKGSIFDTQLDNMKAKFDEFGLTPEQLAEATTQMFVQVSLQYNKDAIQAVNSLMKQEADEPKTEASTLLIYRQMQGYDDNILVKISDQRSSVASFAVNSGSTSAQSAIDAMNNTMGQLESRVEPILGEICPLPPVAVPIPALLGVDSQTDTTITLSWSTVVNATSYELFVDGVSITTTGQAVQVIDSLLPTTKYAFNVRAYIGTEVSALSETVIGTTNATP